MSYEKRFGVWLLAVMVLIFVALPAFLWWQESLGEDAAWVWLCAWMGDGTCGPGAPWIDFGSED